MTNLFYNYYKSENIDRQKELDFCLQKNINNNLINKIYIFSSKKVENVSNKCQIINFERPTFLDLFKFINTVTNNDDINIIINSDIYLDETLNLIKNINNKILCLTRYDVLSNNKIQFFNSTCSQDTWIFKGKIKEINEANFTQGIAGCDNVIAHLFEKHGYEVINPSLTIKTYHLHNSDCRTYIKDGKVLYRLPPPYKLLKPTIL